MPTKADGEIDFEVISRSITEIVFDAIAADEMTDDLVDKLMAIQDELALALNVSPDLA